MSKLKKIRIFFYEKIFGVFLLSIFVFSSLSSFSFSELDPHLGYTGVGEKINNLMGIFGSYYTGTLESLIGNLQYLLPVFFLIAGVKKIVGVKTNLIFVRFFSFLISITILSVLFNVFNIQSIYLGKIILEIIRNNFYYIFENNFYFPVIVILTIIIFIYLFIYGLTIKIKNIKILFWPLMQILNLFLKLSKLLGPIKFKKHYNERPIKEKKFSSSLRSEKREPKIYNDKSVISKTAIYNKYQTKENFNNNEYELPSISLLKGSSEKRINLREINKSNELDSQKLEKILREFGVEGKILGFKTGPIITLYEFLPAPGVKTSKVVSLAEDIARSMSSMSARISFQPGKSSIGIEMPNVERQNVDLEELLKDSSFSFFDSGIILALGKTISGEKKFTDLEKMPHLLIAGTTGSGKSVCINSLILSVLFKFKPSECKLILIDPKMLELSIYEDIPHLLTPVVTDPKKAVFALKWVVREMENRYKTMSSLGVKNIQTYNNKIEKYLSEGKKIFKEVQTGIDKETRLPVLEKQEMPLDKMPLIVVVIDEMADLMMVAGKEVENLVQRLAQMARAAGIHLIAATQRPSVDVITGTIKANFPSRISFRVASKFDSRTIINEMGAEQLLGNGDMLFIENGTNVERVHGGYVSEKEIQKVVQFIKEQSANELKIDITKENKLENIAELDLNENAVDELYEKAVAIVLEKQKASTSFIQRYLQVGYNRAARIIEQMEKEEIVSEADHTGKRSILRK